MQIIIPFIWYKNTIVIFSYVFYCFNNSLCIALLLDVIVEGQLIYFFAHFVINFINLKFKLKFSKIKKLAHRIAWHFIKFLDA